MEDIITGKNVPDSSWSEAKRQEWELLDTKVQKAIILSIDRKMLMHLLNCKTSREMLDKLTSIYGKDTEQKKCALLQEFFNYSFVKESDIATHVSTLENLPCRLHSLNQTIDDTMLITKILATLPAQYVHFASAWDSTPLAEKTLSNLIARLQREENRLKLEETAQENLAFKSSIKKCYKCNGLNHIAKYCRQKSAERNYFKDRIEEKPKTNTGNHSRNNQRCSICKKTNHAERDCYFRKNKTAATGRYTDEKRDHFKFLEGSRSQNGLYVIDMKKTNTLESLLTTNRDTIQWHRKLGHLSFANMQKLINISEGMNSISKFNNNPEICDICIKAKQTRNPFNGERDRASKPLEIIHTDVCGPIEPTTWDGMKYFITFLDDFTHFAAVFPIRGKHEVTEIVKSYLKQCQAKWERKVVKLRCDNGREYANKELQDWCKNNGTILDFTVPYSPQLNGKAERLNRTILEKALSLDSKINKVMWGEAVRTAIYLINRSPTTTSDKTQAENWIKKKPDLTNLQIFGCDAHAKELGYLKKLDERSKKYTMVGYSTNGYRLWDEYKKRIIIVRDVIFKNTSETEEEPINESKTSRAIIRTEHNEINDVLNTNKQLADLLTKQLSNFVTSLIDAHL
ncbi:uncharacterized protein LOC143365143 [Halictus rubicundus]|uniref:uncharacterized protein LOC143365100 n=1 Tax=Halictus rubicundus TaxID=77578 RepID=UPI0040364592